MIVIEEKERDILKKFKERLSDIDLTTDNNKDVHLIRYLRARDLDLNKSEKMFRASLEWRKENQIDTIIADYDPPVDLSKMLKTQYLGKDKAGNPLLFVPFKHFDFKIFADPAEKERLLKFFCWANEWMLHFLKDFEKECPPGEFPQMMCIYDYKNAIFLKDLVNMKAMDLMKKNNENYELNYPEILGGALLFNIPKIFHVIFELFKPMIPKKTLEKFDILDNFPPRCRTSLLKKIPVDVLPRPYGGIRTSPGIELITKDEIPFDQSEEDEKALIEIQIDARDKLSMQISTVKIDAVLAWTIKLDAHDIGFSVTDAKGEELTPYQKIDSVKEFKGSVRCKEIGKYFVNFDNAYSKLRSKTLHYSLKIRSDQEIDLNGTGN